MKIILHGAGKEVGRSCVEIEEDGQRFLFDSGLKITPEENEYPEIPKKLSDIKAIFLSHCHLDHSGALPYFYAKGYTGKVFCNLMTRNISQILLKDSWKVSRIKNQEPGYDKKDIIKILDRFQIVNNNMSEKFKGLNFTYQNAGHIPGASSIEVVVNNKRVLYSGDMNTAETELLPGATIKTKNPDVFIIETTYGDRNHPNRTEQEADFLRKIQETLNNDGKVLIPTFAVGRAQEILLLLNKIDFGVPIYLDGMAKKITEEYIDHPEFLKEGDKLKEALTKVNMVEGRKHRSEIVKEKAIFVTTSGMMDGGPIMDYLAHTWFEEKNSILLTGYQAEGSNGRNLVEKGTVRLDTKEVVKVKCFYKKYDFSAHLGMVEIQQLIKKVNPKLLILNHGDPPSMANIEQWAKEEGLEVKSPKIGEIIQV